MSEVMTCMPFEQLMNWVLEEKKTKGTVFGQHRAYAAETDRKLNIFSHCLRNIKLCRPFTVISFIICKDTWSVDTGCKLCTVHLLNCFQLKETCACIVRSNNVLC